MYGVLLPCSRVSGIDQKRARRYTRPHSGASPLARTVLFSNSRGAGTSRRLDDAGRELRPEDCGLHPGAVAGAPVWESTGQALSSSGSWRRASPVPVGDGRSRRHRVQHFSPPALQGCTQKWKDRIRAKTLGLHLFQPRWFSQRWIVIPACLPTQGTTQATGSSPEPAQLRVLRRGLKKVPLRRKSAQTRHSSATFAVC